MSSPSPTLDPPRYLPGFLDAVEAKYLFQASATFPWMDAVSARREVFYAPREGMEYTYGQGAGTRTYRSLPYPDVLEPTTHRVADALGAPVDRLWCFCNRYETAKNQLGWHADNHTGTDHTYGIGVVSLGAEREIWWRRIPGGPTRTAECGCGSSALEGACPSHPGEVHKLRLAPGSLFVMPPGFQFTHEHRIPKLDRQVGPRVSLTYRVHL